MFVEEKDENTKQNVNFIFYAINEQVHDFA